MVAQPRHAPKYGPIAQLGERTVRIRKVESSILFVSTIILRELTYYFKGGFALRSGCNTKQKSTVMNTITVLLLAFRNKGKDVTKYTNTAEMCFR